MFMVWSSSDSRTPPRRPSMVGRMPILGMSPSSRLTGGLTFMISFSFMIGLNCYSVTNTTTVSIESGAVAGAVIRDRDPLPATASAVRSGSASR